MATLVDPVAKDQKAREQKRQDEQNQSLNVDNMIKGLTRGDLKSVPQRFSKAVHPFDGYPLKYAVMGGQKVCVTHIVVFNNQKSLVQDPSGLGISIFGKDGKERVVNLETFPNRLIMDYETGRNTHVCFDRKVTLDDGMELKWVAFVPSHAVRAQLCFKQDKKTGAIMPDPDILLFDPDQAGRLRRVFDNILSPQRRAERDAKAIMGESQESLDDIKDSSRAEGAVEG